MKLYLKDNEGTSLIKHGSWLESSSLHWLNLLIKLQMVFFKLIKLPKMFIKLNIVSDTRLIFLVETIYNSNLFHTIISWCVSNW